MTDLSGIDWDVILNATTIDEKLSIFNSLLIELYDKHAPLRPIKLKHRPAPWITEDIRALMKKRNAAKSKYKLKPNDLNLNMYKRLRNKCNRVCRDAQRQFVHASVDNKSSSEVWRFLQSLGIGRSKTEISQTTDLNVLNNHFSRSSIPNPDKDQTISLLKTRIKPNHPFFEFEQITSDDIKKHASTISSDAIGCDGISRKMINMVLIEIMPIICHIFNFSLTSKTFPNIWRFANVIPIPKVSNPSLPSHYRPISILPFLSKILERIIHFQLTLFLTRHNILSPFQSGFRLGHSTVTALAKVFDDIRYGMDNKQVTILALLDFSNAFNNVDYDILLAVLESINISSDVIEWFHSYLFGRQQRISVGDRYSSYCRLSAGVPQGSVLSPLLFSIFINTVTELLTVSFHLYADDLQIYLTTPVEKIKEAVETININLNTILNWSQSFGLSVNAAKSQLSVIGTSKQLSKINYGNIPNVMFNGTILDYSSVVKDLGVFVDNSLSWRPQIAEISKKIFATFHSLKRWKNFLPIKTKISLVNSLMLSKLDYADACYPDLSEELTNKLDRLQNLCIRFIFGLKKFDHVSQYRLKLGWLPIKHRRNLHVVTLLYTTLFCPWSPLYLKERFSFLGNSTLHLNLRSLNDSKLNIPTCNTKSYSNSFTVKAVRLWNALPSKIRQSPTIFAFKNRVKNYYRTMT